jgi:hypothetical protein
MMAIDRGLLLMGEKTEGTKVGGRKSGKIR